MGTGAVVVSDGVQTSAPWRERYRAYVDRELGSIDAWEIALRDQGQGLYPQMVENRAVLLSLRSLFDVLEKGEQKNMSRAVKAGRSRA
jgi:hypothetical protein